MALSEQEKDILREFICSAGSLGRLKPSTLKLYSEKSDEEIRELLSTFKTKKAELITKKISDLNVELENLK